MYWLLSGSHCIDPIASISGKNFSRPPYALQPLSGNWFKNRIEYGMVWDDMVCYDMIWHSMYWYVMYRYGMVCIVMVWYVLLWYDSMSCNVL